MAVRNRKPASPRKSAPPKSARGPGRPRTDATDRRARLLDAALTLFARQGIAATPLSAIARVARVTPALLHYYFGDREQLLDAVVAERLRPLIGAMSEELAAVSTGPEAMTLFVRHAIALMDRHPWLPGLWVREFLTEGGALRVRMLAEIGPAVPQRLRALFAQAQRAGKLNTDLDPRLLVVSLVGLTLFAVAATPIWRALFDADDITMEDLTRHVLALLQRGLQPAAPND